MREVIVDCDRVVDGRRVLVGMLSGVEPARSLR